MADAPTTVLRQRLDRLVKQGVLGKARRADRPIATGAKRVVASDSVADLVAQQRR